MKKLEIKHVRLIYDEWKCIESKSYRQKRIKNPDFSGFLALIDIGKVKEKQVWRWGQESLTVCDDGMKWLIIVPETGKYAITVYMNQVYRPVAWISRYTRRATCSRRSTGASSGFRWKRISNFSKTDKQFRKKG